MHFTLPGKGWAGVSEKVQISLSFVSLLFFQLLMY